MKWKLRKPWTFAAPKTKSKRVPFKADVQILKGTAAFDGGTGLDMPYPNPDKLAKEKGLPVYAQMLEECDMCSSSSAYLLLAAISSGQEMQTDGDQPIDLKALDFQKQYQAEMQTSVTQVILGIMDGAIRGVSTSELVWADQITSGELVGLQGLRKIVHKSPEYIGFKVDSYSQIEEDGVWQLNYDIGGERYTKAPLENVIYYAFWPKNDNPYGSPLLRAAYPWYFKKKFIMKEWASFLERYGKPIPIGEVEEGTGDEDRAKFLTMLREIRGNLVAVVTRGRNLKLEQVDMRPTDAYMQAIMTDNRSIARSLLLPAMVLEKDSTGSLALAENQSETQFAWIEKYLVGSVSQAIHRQWIKRVHEHNFGDTAACPYMKFRDFVQEDLQLKAAMYGTLSLIGLPFDIEVLRREFNIPPVDKDAELVGGRPAGGGLLLDDGQIWGRVQPTFPGATAEHIRSYTEMVLEAVNGKLKATPPVYSFGAPRGIDEHIKFDETNAEEDVAADYWSEIGTQVIESMADKVGTGKGNGGRRRV